MYKTEKNKYLLRKNTVIKIRKQAKGITLIALVVTIIVLLILAGVAISLTIGNNGIFTRAQVAVVRNENASVYEQLQFVVADYQLDSVTTGNKEKILSRLKADSYVNDDNTLNVETLMGRNMQTGKGSMADGDVYVIEQREKTATSATADTSSDMEYYLIYYDDENLDINLGLAFKNNSSSNNQNVKITISKTPDTNELTGGVILKVEKVEGINSTINLNDIDISKLNEEQKRNLTVNVAMQCYNYECLEDYLQARGIDEQEYWNDIENLDDYLLYRIEDLKYEGAETINSYIVINPEEKKSNSYLAIKNGNYTFKVIDILNEKTYTEKVEVNNIDENMPYYFVKGNGGIVNLLDKNKNETNFEEAYIIYNGEKIDVINGEQDKNSLGSLDVASKLFRLGKVEDIHDLSGTTQTFEIVKDGVSYFGDAIMVWVE